LTSGAVTEIAGSCDPTCACAVAPVVCACAAAQASAAQLTESNATERNNPAVLILPTTRPEFQFAHAINLR
jgi:hypothetical protein